ncbi:MAG: Crp/Fnr family transcriptional regulator [Saprospiraceae bacterium]|nr:Crp/Fnr family transcriptional regulator [Saprospiraceae bacterium]
MFQASEYINCEKAPESFKKLSQEEREFVNRNKVEILFRKGENICKQGTFAPNVMYLTEGLVKICFEGFNDKNLIVKIVEPYDFIGLSSLNGKNYYHYSATALVDTKVNQIEKECFKTLIANNNEFANETIKWYCDNDQKLFHRLSNITSKQMHARISDTLLYLMSIKHNDGNVLPLFSRKELADLTGVSVESAIRLLSEFKKEGIISITGKKIQVLKKDTLYELSEKG